MPERGRVFIDSQQAMNSPMSMVPRKTEVSPRGPGPGAGLSPVPAVLSAVLASPPPPCSQSGEHPHPSFTGDQELDWLHVTR